MKKEQKWNLILLYIHAARSHMGRKYNLGTGLSKLLKLANKNIQLHSTVKSYLENHGIIPGNTAALQNIRHAFRISIKLWLVIRYYVQINKRNNVISKLHGIYLSMITGNNSVLFQLFNPR